MSCHVNLTKQGLPLFTNYFVIVGGNTLKKQKKCVLTRSIEHQEDNMTSKWEASGNSEHSKDCHVRFN